MKVDPIIVEKDLWVVLTLQSLFDRSHGYNEYQALTFKGGTSLSKAYQIIKRFSEDIDITIDRKFLGFQASDEELKVLSRKQRDKTLEDLKNHGHKFIETYILPYLKTKLSSLVPNEEIGVKFNAEDFLSIEIFYPSRIQPTYNSYVKPRIYVEFGVKGDPYPTETKNVRSYLHENIKPLNDLCVPVNVLLPIRTFFEKVTLLHAEAHADGPRQRISRHYYDLYQLVKQGYLEEAKTQLELLKNVIAHKSLFFASKKASYETIYSSGLKLLPSEDGLRDIQIDYKEMGLMIFGENPPFEAVINSIKEIEIALNNEILNA
jgi:predicted nucleotidyltransferase component of viral defense system